MTKPLLFELSAAAGLGDSLCAMLDCERGQVSRRHFPDGESYFRFLTAVGGRNVILLCTLDRPDPKIPSLLFAAAAAREQGAATVGLVAPYLAYMRQDKAFQHGEAVTSTAFANLVSTHFDWLSTVDPHLHRHARLSEIYSVPSTVAHATQPIVDWLTQEVAEPVIVGPDEESLQWVQAIATAVGGPATVLRKVRNGDLEVSIDGRPLGQIAGRNVVIVDDIASSARTLVEAVRLVRATTEADAMCIVVHPIFAGDSYEKLQAAGAKRIVSTNTVEHSTNAIDIAETLAQAVWRALNP
jgi:ribose-phosphate pyrophosphokinase